MSCIDFFVCFWLGRRARQIARAVESAEAAKITATVLPKVRLTAQSASGAGELTESEAAEPPAKLLEAFLSTDSEPMHDFHADTYVNPAMIHEMKKAIELARQEAEKEVFVQSMVRKGLLTKEQVDPLSPQERWALAVERRHAELQRQSKSGGGQAIDGAECDSGFFTSTRRFGTDRNPLAILVAAGMQVEPTLTASGKMDTVAKQKKKVNRYLGTFREIETGWEATNDHGGSLTALRKAQETASKPFECEKRLREDAQCTFASRGRHRVAPPLHVVPLGDRTGARIGTITKLLKVLMSNQREDRTSRTSRTSRRDSSTNEGPMLNLSQSFSLGRLSADGSLPAPATLPPPSSVPPPSKLPQVQKRDSVVNLRVSTVEREADKAGGVQQVDVANFFNIIDGNGDGAVSIEEMHAVMRSLGQFPSAQYLRDIFNTHGDGKSMTLTQFQSFMSAADQYDC